MKIKIIIYILLAVFSFTACNDEEFLDVKPLDRYSDAAVFEDEALLQAYVYNIYMNQMYGFHVENFASLTDLAVTKRGQVNDFVTGNISDSYLSILEPGFYVISFKNTNWNELFKYIRKCNMYFEKMEESSLTGDVVDKLTGEVHFLRAYFYYWLVNYFGGAPIIDHTYAPGDDFSIARNTFEETINFIVADLDAAADALPTGGDKARATKGAALALKSRVLLFAASDLYNTGASWTNGYTHPELVSYIGGDRTARWQAARDAAKDLIDLEIYRLYGGTGDKTPEEATENYVNLFINHGNEEDILLTYYDNINNDDGWQNPSPGLFWGPNGWHCWGNNAPSQALVDAFEMIDGTVFDWNDSTTTADFNPYENRDPRFYADILYDGAHWRERPDDIKASDSIGIVQTGFYEDSTGSFKGGLDTRDGIDDWNTSKTGYFVRKFIDPELDHQFDLQKLPWRQIRYAEVLLNYAEACIELGEDGEARTYINMIRNRAGMPDLDPSLTGNELKEHYRNERKIELCYEHHRFFDIRRWMIAPEVLVSAEGIRIEYPYGGGNPTYSRIISDNRLWVDKTYFLPIMLDELNRNVLLIQNPGY